MGKPPALSSGFALFEGVVSLFRGDVDRGALDRWGLDSRKGSRLGVGQPARLRNSISWASCFFAGLFAKLHFMKTVHVTLRA